MHQSFRDYTLGYKYVASQTVAISSAFSRCFGLEHGERVAWLNLLVSISPELVRACCNFSPWNSSGQGCVTQMYFTIYL